jgi:transcriptional regulator with XRE-family HTH domain
MFVMPSLREIREKKFLTQEELAQRAGLIVVTINRIEKGRQKPRFKTIRKLAEALGIQPGDIDFKT